MNASLRFLAGAGILSGIAVSAAVAEPEVFVKSHGYQGIHGITFDAEDRLYAGSVLGQRIYRVDPETGASEVWQDRPYGMADDLEFGPDGRLVWTSFMLGQIHARDEAGAVTELADGLPGINSLAFRKDGRLFATQVFLGDALHEIDPTGEAAPRTILENLGGLNGFDFGPDGYLYGPLWFKGQIVRVDVDAGTVEVVADGFDVPAAANFNSQGELYALDTARGDVVRVDIETGRTKTVATVRTGLDNLAFDSRDRLFVTGMAEGAILEIDPEYGSVRPVKDGPVGVPTDLAVYDGTLWIADTFSLRAVDIASKRARAIARYPHAEYPLGIDVTADHVHVSSWFGSTVQTFDRRTDALVHTYHDIAAAYDVLEDADGSLLVLQMFPGAISRIGPDGVLAPVVRGLPGATAMARAGRGAVYVSLFGKGEVVRVELGNGETSVVADGLDGPEGIAAMPDGRVVVAESGAGRVRVIDPESGRVETVGTGLSLDFPLPPGVPPMGATAGVAVDATGRIYVSSQEETAVYRLNRE